MSSPDDLARLLADLQLVLLKYPRATQAALRALVAEGRRFAETPEGRRWHARLAASALVRRGHVLWGGSLLDLFDPSEDRVVPTAYVDAVVAALARHDLQALLERSLSPRDDDGLGPA